jgi:hypothetical protein
MTQGRNKPPVLAERPGRDATATAVVDDIFPNLMAEAVQPRRGHDQIATAVVDDISPDGVARVSVSGETQSCEASSVLRFASAAAASEALLGHTVLVLLNPPSQPVILGVVAQRLWDKRETEGPAEAQAKLPAGEPVAVQVDKRRVELEASEEIRLTCGKSSLVMRRDGTVIVRGVTITSRASQSNKIRGGTVSIN